MNVTVNIRNPMEKIDLDNKKINRIPINCTTNTIIKEQAGGFDVYNDKYSVTPSTKKVVLETKDKVLRENVTVEEVPVYETSNEFGTTVYIVSEVL